MKLFCWMILCLCLATVALAKECEPLILIQESSDELDQWELRVDWPRKAIKAQSSRAATGQPEELHRYAVMLMSSDDALARQVQAEAVARQPERQLFNWYRMFELASEAGEAMLSRAALLGDPRAQRLLANDLLENRALSSSELQQLYAWRESVGIYRICLYAHESGNQAMKSVCRDMAQTLTPTELDFQPWLGPLICRSKLPAP